MKWRLLADVPDDEVRMLLAVARRRRFARGEVVFHRDDPADSLHLMLDERLLEALYLPSEKRVLRRLVDLALVYGDGSAETELPFTQEDLASFAGSSRATVNRVLRDEQKRGTVELRRGKTLVRDLEALRKRAR